MTNPAPSRRTPRRPSSRSAEKRSIILDSAELLISRLGYHRVNMAQIAARASMGATGLYYYFPSKADVLRALVVERMQALRDDTAKLETTEDTASVTSLVDLSLNHRRVPLLWQREARYLEPDDQTLVHHLGLEIERAVVRYLTGSDDALAISDPRRRGALAVLWSPASHSVRITRRRLVRRISEMVLGVLNAELPTKAGAQQPQDAVVGEPAASRREEIIWTAAELFADRGFDAVSIDDVAAKFDVSGPSLYKHFSNKAELLYLALRTGGAELNHDLDAVIASHPSRSDVLPTIAGSYAGVLARRPAIAQLLISEVGNLPSRELAEIRDIQHAYLDALSSLIAVADERLDGAECRITVHAVLGLVNELMRTNDLASPNQTKTTSMRNTIHAISVAMSRTENLLPKDANDPEEV